MILKFNFQRYVVSFFFLLSHPTALSRILLTADEMELLLDTREYQVGLFALLRGHTQLVVLETEEGVHAFTRAAHAFRPGLSAPPEELAARLLYQISQQELTLKKLMKCSAPALQTLL